MEDLFTFEKPWEQVEKEFAEYELMKAVNNENLKLVKEDSLIQSLKQWLSKTSYMQFRKSIEKRVLGQKNLGLFLLVVYRYIATIVNGGEFPSGVLLAAPSGCGKTETYRALRDYFRKAVPEFGNVISQIDASALTPNGYKGTDISIITEAMKEHNTEGIGIVFLDEFDKVLSPLGTCSEDIHSNVVHELLTLIEGINEDDIDTGKTLFVCSGAFDMCRQNRKEASKGIGFISNTDMEMTTHYSPITKEDILNLGVASHELMGRISMLINYEPLDYASVDQIIDMTARKVSGMCGVNIVIAESMRKHLHKASNTEYGCRLFYNIIMEEAIKAMTEIYENNVMSKCKSLVLQGTSQYNLIMK